MAARDAVLRMQWGAEQVSGWVAVVGVPARPLAGNVPPAHLMLPTLSYSLVLVCLVKSQKNVSERVARHGTPTMNGGQHCSQRGRWLSSGPSLSSQGSRPHLPSPKLCFLHPGWPMWALRKEGLPCRECGPKAAVTCSLPLGDACQGCPVLA